MHLNIDFNPQVSERIAKASQMLGIDPEKLVESLVVELLPQVEAKSAPRISAKNADAIAYLDRKLKEDATDDPEEIRRSEQEVEELMQSLNRNRVESGERPLFP